ncbi:MAG TPA: hypothetical protein VHU61_00960 [Solirubrobacteraceae bacterium]|jgi:hypothetical protein|nr:hypothetical protein [Solirubrobacteraceae bacterium]
MTDSNARLERRYRRLLGLYPRSYREQHGEDLLGVLMTDSDRGAGGGSRTRLAAALDLVRNAFLVHTRYWWEMRTATERGSFPVRHPLVVIRVRLAVAVWLCVVTTVLCAEGQWWGLAILVFVVIHLVLAGRTAKRYRTR